MVREIPKIPHGSVQNAEDRDTRYLKVITRKLLQNVEKAAELYNSATPAELVELEKNHNLLFGSKASLAGTLVILTDLMLRLNQVLPDAKAGVTEEKQAHFLSEYDIALVEAFVKKLKPNAVVSVGHIPAANNFPDHNPLPKERKIKLKV